MRSAGTLCREFAAGEDSFMAALYSYAGWDAQLEYMLRVIAGGMRAAHMLDERAGDVAQWS